MSALFFSLEPGSALRELGPAARKFPARVLAPAGNCRKLETMEGTTHKTEPLLIDAGRSCLLAVDLQRKLAPAIADRAGIIDNARRLLSAARLLEVPAVVSEQYPQGLGGTLPELAGLLPAEGALAKLSFSCLGEPGFRERLEASGRTQIVVFGMEAHVCVLQTVMELIEAQQQVFVVVDACGSRQPRNAAVGLERMAHAGAVLVTTEMVLFEWLRRAGTDRFKQILPLIK
ncbi:MAG: hydrolase [Kiloniellales bacterium]